LKRFEEKKACPSASRAEIRDEEDVPWKDGYTTFGRARTKRHGSQGFEVVPDTFKEQAHATPINLLARLADQSWFPDLRPT